MKHLRQRTLVVAIGLAGIIGVVLGLRALGESVRRAQDLYQIYTVGSQIESELEYEAQESRRAFLYALAVPDPNDQLPYIDAAREASRQVGETANRMRGLRAARIATKIRDFELSWLEYARARDEILANILEGDTAAAIRAEHSSGQPAFQSAIERLHALKATLEVDAKAESMQVDQTLKLCGAGLTAFVLSTFAIVASLFKANRGRRRALESLHSSNQTLADAREAEKQRASILEMVSTHAGLSRTLTRIVELAPKCNAKCGAAIWTVNDSVLQLQVHTNLPNGMPESLGAIQLGSEEEAIFSNLPEIGADNCTLASQFGLVALGTRPLRDAGGRVIGMLRAFAPPQGELPAAVLDQMAQLASIAIENTLLYERLAFQAQHDSLTGLPNRLLFHDRVQQATLLAARHRKKAAVILIDLDRYKQVNDTLGHRVGDEVLCEVGRRLKHTLRESDAVARIGGDEFTVLVHDLSTREDVDSVAAKILLALSRPMKLEGHEFSITATAGVSVFPEHGDEAGKLLRNADLAMYSAKQTGGNTYCLFRPALGDSVERRVQIEYELKSALINDEFSLAYQPLINRNGGMGGLEALLRWNNPKLGNVSPSDFIPIAEEMGMIVPIGEWVIRAACRDGARWLLAGYDIPRIAFNASALQLVQKGFATTVQQALKDFRFPPSKLEVEITETALMNNLEQVLEQIELLRDSGVTFSIDDFGTGYSSLSQLWTLPVDRVKVDRSFIKDLEVSGNGCSTLVRGIIALAHNLHLEVVAEGVETEAQLAMLNSMGCDVNQGFLLHRPMPAAAIEKLLLRSVPETVPVSDLLIPSPA